MENGMNPSLIRILIADDHIMVRVGLSSMLGTESDFEIIGDAANGIEAISLHRELRPDVLLLDVRMPGLGGIEVLRSIKEEFPEAIILMLSTSDLEDEVAQAYEAGAAGYLLKTEKHGNLVRSIREAANGRRIFSQPLLNRLNKRRKLSSREVEVLSAVRLGLSNKEISDRLGISEHTVKEYLKTIFEKLETHDRAGAVSKAFALGVLKVG